MTSGAHVAFVRAVMIGREGLHRQVLLEMFERGGASDVVSYLSTGNVSFSADSGAVATIVDRVETDLEQLLGRSTPLFVRSLAELRALLDSDPFANAPFDAVRDRIVTFFRDRVPPRLELPIEHPGGDWVVFAGGPAEVMSVTRAREDGRHPGAPGGVIEQLAGEPVTTRSLSTLERITARLR